MCHSRRQAIDIITELREFSGSGPWLFPSVRSVMRPISENTLNAALRRLGYPASPKEVRRICGDLGLKIVTCQPFRDFEGLPEEKRRRAFDRAERHRQMAL